MKKILWAFILMSLFKIDVSANESLEYAELSNVTPSANVLTEKRYQYYRLEKDFGPYASINEETGYEYFDKSDYILGPKSSFTITKPIAEDYVVTSEPGAYYERVSGISYLKFTLNSEDNEFTSFKLYDKDKQLKIFDMSQTKALLDQMSGTGYIKEGGMVKISFHELHYLDDLTLEFSFQKENDVDFTIETGNGQVYTKDNYQNVQKLFFKDSTLVNPKYEYFYDVLKETSNALKIVKPVTLYYTEEKLYHYYNLIKVYNDEYTVNPVLDFIYKDEDKFKIFYTYLPFNKKQLSNNDMVVEEKKEEKVEPLKNEVSYPTYLKSNNLNNKINDYVKPDLKTNNLTISKPKTLEKEDNFVYVIYFLIFFLLSILILVLSKSYEKKWKYARVK